MTLEGRWDGDRFICREQPMVPCRGKFSLVTGHCLECGSQVTDHDRPLRAGDTVTLPCPDCDEGKQHIHGGDVLIACDNCGGSGAVEYIVADVTRDISPDMAVTYGWVVELKATT